MLTVKFNKKMPKVRSKIERHVKAVLSRSVRYGVGILARMDPNFDYPHWTGSYMASWSVYEGSAGTDYVSQPGPWQERKQVAGSGNPLAAMGKANNAPQPSRAFTKMIIANSWHQGTVSAASIENEGSKKHHEPWKVGAFVYDQIKLNGKFVKSGNST